MLCGLSIARTKGKNKFGVNILSAFYFISGLSAIVIIVAYSTLIIAKNASEHYSEPHYIVPNTLLSVVLIGSLTLYYTKRYRLALVKMATVRPQQITYEPVRIFSAPKMPLVTFNIPDANKPTKSCPFCGETILAVAVKCKHCGEWLPKKKQKTMVKCPVCGELMEEGIDICPYCHEKMDGSELIPDNVISPTCNERIK